MNNLQTRLDAASNKRYAAIAKMEDAMHRMTVAERNGGGADPRDSQTFEDARQAVQTVDVELRELQAEAREALGDAGTVRLDISEASGMSNVPEWSAAPGHARVFGSLGTPGRVDSAPLWRALRASPNKTTGKIVCRALLQGVAVGNLGRVTDDAPLVVAGTYGALALVLAVQTIPTVGGIFYFNRIEPTTPPAMGAKQATEGAAKAQVALKSVPTSLILDTFAAFEKVSVQALDDQSGLAAAIESILTGAVLRAADAAVWAAFLAGSTAIVPSVDVVSTIVKTAALVATAGGGGVRAVLSPADYADMVLTKASTAGSWMGLPPGATMPTIVQSSGVPAGKLLVTASTDGSFVAMRQTVESIIGLDGNDLTLNLRTIVCEGRMAFGVRNPALSYVGDLHS